MVDSLSMAIEAKGTPPSATLNAPKPSNPAGVRSVYSNNLGVSATATDVQLIFTELRQAGGIDSDMAIENAVVALVTIPLELIPHVITGLTVGLENSKAARSLIQQANNPKSAAKN